MTYAEQTAKTGAMPWQWVEFEVERCGLNYGTSPCTAALLSGIVEHKCFNSWATCQDVDNFSSGEFWVRFCEPRERIPLAFPFADPGMSFFMPLLTRVSHDPVRLDPGKSLGVRAALTFSLMDAPHHDIGIDRYVSERSYDPMQQGLFLAKLRARFPHFIGRRVRWYQGYMTDNPTLGDFEMREFIIETFAGPSSRGQFTVSARDPLKLTTEDRAQAPLQSTGVLAFDVTDEGDPGTIDVATTDPEQYPITGCYLFINGEGFTATAATLAPEDGVDIRFTGVTRTLPTGYATDARAHSAGDRVQLGLYLEGRSVDVLRTLLLDYSPNFREEWIPFAEWEAEHDDWLGTSSIRRMITEPEGVDKIIDELIEETMTWGVWWDEYARLVRYRSLHPADTDETVPPLNDDQHFIADSVSATTEPKRHINEVQCLYGQIDPTGRKDDRQNYSRGAVLVDADSQSAIEEGQRRVRQVFSRWNPPTNARAVDQWARRLINTMATVPIRVDFSLVRKDATSVNIATFADVTTQYLVDVFGLPRTVRVQIIRALIKDDEIEYQAREDFFKTRFARWAPSELAELGWTDATDAQKARYMFWSDADGLYSDTSLGKQWL